MKHTPGPWKYNIRTDSIEGPEGQPVCGMIFGTGTPLEVKARNVLLIEGTPEMLEALKIIIEKADSDPFATIGMYVEHGKGSTIRALITKIEGQAS